MGITSMVFGIISLFLAGPIFGPLAVLFGIVSLCQNKPGENKGIAIAGIATGTIGTVVGVLMVIIFFLLIAPQR